jgi:hypothetical protein
MASFGMLDVVDGVPEADGGEVTIMVGTGVAAPPCSEEYVGTGAAATTEVELLFRPEPPLSLVVDLQDATLTMVSIATVTIKIFLIRNLPIEWIFDFYPVISTIYNEMHQKRLVVLSNLQ